MRRGRCRREAAGEAADAEDMAAEGAAGDPVEVEDAEVVVAGETAGIAEEAVDEVAVAEDATDTSGRKGRRFGLYRRRVGRRFFLGARKFPTYGPFEISHRL